MSIQCCYILHQHYILTEERGLEICHQRLKLRLKSLKLETSCKFEKTNTTHIIVFFNKPARKVF